MRKGVLVPMLAAAMLAGAPMAASAADFSLRATANSNENDEDYDGLIVFKNYVEQASNGAIEVELFIGTQLCSNGSECLAGVADGNIDVVHPDLGRHRKHLPVRPGSGPALSDGRRPGRRGGAAVRLAVCHEDAGDGRRSRPAARSA